MGALSTPRTEEAVIAGLALFALLAGTTWIVNRLGEDEPPEDEWKPVLTWY